MTIALFENCLHTSQKSENYLFTESIQTIIAYNQLELITALKNVSKYQQLGFYLAGYIAYDAIYYLDNKLNHLADITAKQPLLHFEVFKTCTQFDSTEFATIFNTTDDQLNIDFMALHDDYANYQHKFNQVQHNLQHGNSYQINLTSQVQINTSNIDIISLYQQLTRSHPVAYAAFLDFAPITIASISPELFFKKQADKITVKPMKGTYPRGKTSIEDEINRNTLATDNKNLAENLIIVDLLRNDLAKIAQTGTVKAQKLFVIEEYNSVFQMTSTIDAQIKIETSFEQIIRNLFPCGSITGAPKLKTMELIHEIEQNPRGIYTGAIGYILPNNDMQFNVAIRTLSKHMNDDMLKIGVGGGITVNSTSLDEWQEIYTKLQFVRKFYTPNFKLIESLLFSNGKFNNLHEHLQRLAHSSQKLLFACDIALISKRLDELSMQLDTALHYKVRIEIDYLGTCAVDFARITPNPKELKVAISDQMIDTTHELFKHKTTSSLVRGLYEQLYQDHKPDNIDELLFINHAGFITESRFYNIIIVINLQWITPPVNDGLLAGVYRQQLIQRGKLTERQITKQDILTADAIYICNDVRGLISCQLESND